MFMFHYFLFLMYNIRGYAHLNLVLRTHKVSFIKKYGYTGV